MAGLFDQKGHRSEREDLNGNAAGVDREREEREREREKAEQAASQKAQAVAGYEGFKESIASYEKNRGTEILRRREVKRLEDTRPGYMEMWDTSIARAEGTWLKKQGQTQAKAEQERAQARKEAAEEKAKRREEADQREKRIQDQIQTLDKQQAEIKKKQQVCQDTLTNVDSRAGTVFACDKNAQSFLTNAKDKGYLSQSQKQMCAQPAEEFCSKWAAAPAALKQLEEKLLTSAFYKNVTGYQVDGSGLSSTKMLLQVFVTAVLILFAVLGRAFHESPMEKLGAIALFCFWVALIMIIATVIGLFSKKKNGILIAGLVVGILLGISMWPKLFQSMPADVICAVIAGFLPRLLLNIPMIGKRVAALPQFIKLEYQGMFRNPAQFEAAQGDAGKTDAVQKTNAAEIDAMIVCYLRHDELLSYLNADERNKLIEETSKQIQELAATWQKAEEAKKQCNRAMADVNALRESIRKMDQETDRKLRARLEELDRKYGGSAKPDFALRKNLLPEDSRALAKTEESVGLKYEKVKNKSNAIIGFDQRLAEEKTKLEQAQKAVQDAVAVIQKWFSSDFLPPFECGEKTEGGKRRKVYNYAMEEYICLCKEEEQNNPNANPMIIRYGGSPLVVECNCPKEQKEEVYMMAAIRELWKAFIKMVPKELMRMALIDASGMLKHFYYLEGTRTEFGEYAKEKLFPGGDGKISCLFSREDIMQFDGELAEQDRARNEYNRKNKEAIANVSETNRTFAKINYTRTSAGTPIPLFYYVVFIVVPRAGDNSTEAPGRIMDAICSMADDGFERGFLPIVVYSKNNGTSERWQSLLDDVQRNGRPLRM